MTETHRHYWTHTDDDPTWRCAECAETTETCRECGRYVGDETNSSSLLICDRCVRRWQKALDDIATAVSWYRWAPPSLIRATRYDRVIVTGSKSEEEQDAEDGAEADRWAIDEIPGILNSWKLAWCEARGDSTSPLPVLDYMKGMILWAAQTPEVSGWQDWKATVLRVLYVAKRDAGLLPKRMSTPCVYCGGIAVQTWADRDMTPHRDGLSERITCLGNQDKGKRCGYSWTEAEWKKLATTHLHLLPLTAPEVLVNADQLRLVWPEVPSSTWRRWKSEDIMPDAASWDAVGRPLYTVASLMPLVERRASETRRGRPARKSDRIEAARTSGGNTRRA